MVTDNKYLINLASFIKQKRLSTGLSLNKFSFEYELESSTISRYELHKRVPKLDVLSKIAKIYGQSLAEFLTEFENEYND